MKRQERQLAEQKQTLASLEEAFAWHTSQIDSLKKTRAYLENEIEQVRTTVESDLKALEWRRRQVQDLERTLAARDEALEWRAAQIEELENRIEAVIEEMTARVNEVKRDMTFELELATKALDAIHSSAGWKFILKVRAVRSRLLPEGSVRYRFYNRMMRFVRGR